MNIRERPQVIIKKVKLSNFKSFRELEVEFSNFNVLIGPNASGKSNLVQVFQFLKDIANFGLDNAVSLQGGIEYLRNVSLGSSRDLSIEIVFEINWPSTVTRIPWSKIIRTKVNAVHYSFALSFSKGKRFEIMKDEIQYYCDFGVIDRRPGKTAEGRPYRKEVREKGEITISNVKGKIKTDVKVPASIADIREYLIRQRPALWQPKLAAKTLLLQVAIPFILPRWEVRLIGDIGIYDFDPKLPKRAVPITGKAELEHDGSNLSIVLKNVIQTKDKERKFSHLIGDLLPFVDAVDIEKTADRSLLFKMKEIYFSKKYLPASLISDGTINITALIIALYFERVRLVIIEEPERNIHPFLISKVVDMIKDASSNKQIIITTHNPEIVRYAGKDHIMLVSRDKEGFSTIVKPAEKKEIQEFLRRDMAIEELYVQNLLGI